MDPFSNTKAALNLWCSKKKLKIDYNFNSDNAANNHAFYCEVLIQSINKVVGTGHGSSKKAASNQAALESLRYLVQQKYITESDLSQQCFKLLNIDSLLFGNVDVNLTSSSDKYNNNQINEKINKNDQQKATPNNKNTQASKSKQQTKTTRFYLEDNNQSRNPENSYNYSARPPDHFNGPLRDHFNDPPLAHFNGPPRSHFSGPRGRNRMPPPPPLPRYSNRPRFEHRNDYSSYGHSPQISIPPYSHDQRMSPSHNQYSYHFDKNRKNFRNRKTPGNPGNYTQTKEAENNVLKMENLDLNAGNEENINVPNIMSNRIPGPNSSDSEDSIVSLLKDAKKRKFDSDSARHKLELIQNECNFNMDNSKQQLNIFFQLNRIKTDYEYNSFGPPHSKTFIAKLRFYVYKNKKEYFAEEKGNSKQDASRLCALNILHQLYKDNLIESFEPDALSKRQLMKMSLIYILNVKQELKDHLMQAYSYVLSYNHYAQHLQLINPALNQQPEVPKQGSTFLYWCPPLENYNPWTNCNLDGTYYAGKSKEDINIQLQSEFQNMIKSPKFQNVLAVRMKLPIWEHKEKVINLIESNPVVIIKGSTGCGKTTQVSQFILDSYIKAANGANCNIIVTQPRRISAISIAERVAYERCEELKDGKYSVGYAVRFDHVYPRPYGSILFCTTGHLLRRIQGGLKGVSHLIIDEVHERDINTDLLLIIIRDLIKLDLNIHVIIMSATLGVSHFQKYFNCQDVLEIDSHVFPVRRYYLEDTIEMIKWRPKTFSYMEDDVEITEDIENDAEFDYPKSISQYTIDLLKQLKEGVICFELIVSLLEHIHSLTITGSVLIFLPGWNSIFGLLNYLKRHHIFGNENKFLILPLHSQLSHKDNNRIFQHSIQRKIILSTNIAETSITIDDVVFVIDTCLIKRKLYCARTNVTSFVIDWVSRSNIHQRQGRAGRVRSGYFFVLCTKKRYDMLEEFKKPEILVSSLVETSLLIKYLGFGSVTAFLQRALDPPAPKAVDEALETLRAINAFDRENELTALGSILAKMPIDPRIGRMVIESILLNVASPITTIAAASSINFELFDNTDLSLLLQTLLQLDEERFSDHLIAFKVFNMCEKNDPSSTYRCINFNAITVVQNARKQLVGILTKCGFNEELFALKPSYLYSAAEFDLIAGLLITAFYPNVCIHKDTRRILTNEERIGLIHKTSVFYSYVNNQKLSRKTKLKSPVFIYSEKSQNKNLISSKQMTMVSFLQLLLFGVKTFEFPSNATGNLANTVMLDGWIEIQIDAEVFDYIWQMKTEFEQLITRVCSNPEYVKTQLDTMVLNAIGSLCLFDNISVDIIGK